MKPHAVLLFFAMVAVTVDGEGQPPPGHCSTHNFGGASMVHYYSCCNNCDDPESPCKGKTYHTASSGRYCGDCGEDLGGGLDVMTKTFRCGGCSGQDRIEKKCKDKWNVWDTPGFCWRFNYCFKHQCQTISVGIEEDGEAWCGDGICQPGETTQTCAMDCCQAVNPACNLFQNGTCPPICCSEETCCNKAAFVAKSTCIMLIAGAFLAFY